MKVYGGIRTCKQNKGVISALTNYFWSEKIVENGKTDIFILEISYIFLQTRFLNLPNMKPYTSIFLVKIRYTVLILQVRYRYHGTVPGTMVPYLVPWYRTTGTTTRYGTYHTTWYGTYHTTWYGTYCTVQWGQRAQSSQPSFAFVITRDSDLYTKTPSTDVS